MLFQRCMCCWLVRQIKASALDCLRDQEYLSDVIIHYYVHKIELETPETVRRRFHVFNTFFFNKLTVVRRTSLGLSQKSHTSDRTIANFFLAEPAPKWWKCQRQKKPSLQWSPKVDKGRRRFWKGVSVLTCKSIWTLVACCCLQSRCGGLSNDITYIFYFLKAFMYHNHFFWSTNVAGAIDDKNLEPFVIHMDSMKEGHNSKEIGQLLCK